MTNGIVAKDAANPTAKITSSLNIRSLPLCFWRQVSLLIGSLQVFIG
jgi:hypothetical protein